MSLSKLSEILNADRTRLLAEWVSYQNESGQVRGDLITERELTRESEQFFELLREALGRESSAELHRPGYKGVRDFLGELSRSRSRLGFTPSETALFILSMKRPVFGAVQRAFAGDAAGQAAALWMATELLDNLGLFTMETFMEAREEVIKGQQSDMLELSTPVVQLWDGIVALPLIGTLDSNRTSIVMETLLQVIVQTRSEIAIIDITGVPTVDTQVAQHLLKTVAAARLMGADCIISGIRPQIAQTMVHLQIDLGNVITKATMAEALRTAMHRSGFVVTRKSAGGLLHQK
ncbi:MAG: hypothetical protein JWL81_3251 [Verrucomicrobiales bacterium]|nr:hypothetical protein [Verrucomicrobiales bacterium]